MKHFFACCVLILLLFPAVCADGEPLRDAVVLIIRHAEKPESGYELSPAGHERAAAYVKYFKNFTIDGKPLHLDRLIAAADSMGSHRPRLTLEPLSQALGLPIDTRFKDKDFQRMTAALASGPHAKQILICWHHGEIPNLIQALGADPSKQLPDSKWPEQVFGWVIQLRFDHDGKLVENETKRINENLMPGDGR